MTRVLHSGLREIHRKFRSKKKRTDHFKDRDVNWGAALRQILKVRSWGDWEDFSYHNTQSGRGPVKVITNLQVPGTEVVFSAVGRHQHVKKGAMD